MLYWIIMVLLTIMAALVLVGAITLLVMMLGLHRTPPFLSIQSAGLEELTYDRQLGGPRDIRLSLSILAENGNR